MSKDVSTVCPLCSWTAWHTCHGKGASPQSPAERIAELEAENAGLKCAAAEASTEIECQADTIAGLVAGGTIIMDERDALRAELEGAVTNWRQAEELGASLSNAHNELMREVLTLRAKRDALAEERDHYALRLGRVELADFEVTIARNASERQKLVDEMAFYATTRPLADVVQDAIDALRVARAERDAPVQVMRAGVVYRTEWAIEPNGVCRGRTLACWVLPTNAEPLQAFAYPSGDRWVYFISGADAVGFAATRELAQSAALAEACR